LGNSYSSILSPAKYKMLLFCKYIVHIMKRFVKGQFSEIKKTIQANE
jgi:hypothetical protein